MSVTDHCSHRERGAVLVAGTVGILILLAFGAFVVDLLRMERIGRSLQRTADAAAIAAALRLKGDPYGLDSTIEDSTLVNGWRDAKRAAVLAVRQNLIAEDSGAIANGTGWELGGVADPWEQVPSFAATTIKQGNLRITIERGAWLYKEEEDGFNADAAPNGPYFESLEQDSGFCPTDSICGGAGKPNINYVYANGARVVVEFLRMRTFFPIGLAGTVVAGGFTRESVASTGAE